MTEQDHYINFPRQECIFHPGENFACVKQLGPLSEVEAKTKADILREIFPELSGKIEAIRNGNVAKHIPQMCQDCKFRIAGDVKSTT